MSIGFMGDKERQKTQLFVFKDFDKDLSSYILSTLLYYVNYDAERDINIFINSDGGYVTDLMAIIDSLSLVKSTVSTYCMGKASSCAAVLLSSGKKGFRFIGKNSRVMLHQVTAGCYGNIQDVNIDIAEANKANEAIISILASNTGKPKEEIRQDLKNDLNLSAQEAIEYGLVDKIINDSNVIFKSFDFPLEFKSDCLELSEPENSNEIEYLEFKSLEIKADKEDGDYFYFSGYAAVFNNADERGDILYQGAFLDSLKERKPVLCYQHIIQMPIGVLDTVQEDSKGLFVTGRLPKGNSDSKNAGELLKCGAINSMSIGFIKDPLKTSYDNNYRHLRGVKLYEVSFVTIPMNNKAKVLSIKGSDLNTITDVNRFLKTKGLSNSESNIIISKIKALVADREDIATKKAEDCDNTLVLELLKMANSINSKIKEIKESK